MIALHTAGLLIVQDRKLLLAYSKNKHCFYLPGGKIDNGESAAEALCREIEEELNVHLNKEDLKYYTHISAPAFGELDGIMMEQECFLIEKIISPSASGEIGEVRYFSLQDYRGETNQAPGAVMLLEKLKLDGFID